MRRMLVALVGVAIVAAAAVWVLTEPRPLAADVLPAHVGDAAKGAVLFWVGGCYSCHAAADAPTGADPFGPGLPERPELPGGKPLVTPVGTFYPPNISPDTETGIGRWSMIDFVNAMKRGLGRDGSHLYPAFPYTSYQRMTYEDLIDLKAFLDTLPPVAAANKPHHIAFPYSLRRVLGLWKLAFLDGRTFAPDPALGDAVNRGAALVEGPGHCNECHTPRHLFGALGLGILDDLTGLGYLGGLDYAHALGGAPSLSGSSKPAPNITPGKGGIGDQSADDLLIALLTGGGNMGGDMADVQRNLAMVNQLAPDDLKAIVAYLGRVKPVDSPPAARK